MWSEAAAAQYLGGAPMRRWGALIAWGARRRHVLAPVALRVGCIGLRIEFSAWRAWHAFNQRAG